MEEKIKVYRQIKIEIMYKKRQKNFFSKKRNVLKEKR